MRTRKRKIFPGFLTVMLITAAVFAMTAGAHAAAVPEGMEIEPGQLVAVPFGNRTLEGFAVFHNREKQAFLRRLAARTPPAAARRTRRIRRRS